MDSELKVNQDENDAESEASLSEIQVAKTEIKDLIYTVRGQQVMLDSDLAALYKVETRVFNQAVNRNARRFPDSFRFQITLEEYENLKSQIVISSGWGGRRKLPYVFTEQGVAMLSGVLRSDIAIDTSIQIMNAFVQMRRFLADNAGLLQRMDVMEVRQLEYQRQTDRRLEQVFGYLEARGAQESMQTIFFDGQIYDAFELLTKLIKKAKKEIILIDGYVDLDTLNILAKKHRDASVLVYTTKQGNKLTKADVEKFNAQYPLLTVEITDAFHDRFLIMDKTLGYHIGASIKDAGRRCFGINRIEDEEIVSSITKRLDRI